MTKPHFQAAGNNYMDTVIEHVSLVFSSVLGAKGVKTVFPYSWKNKSNKCRYHYLHQWQVGMKEAM